MEFAEFIKTPMVDKVVLRRPFTEPLEGTLCITGHHLIISSRGETDEEVWVGTQDFTTSKQLVGPKKLHQLHQEPAKVS
jgi:hypothetical protein